MMTLQAAYMDPILKRFINPNGLRHLLIKTLQFLRLHAHRSSTLYTDYEILLHSGQQTGLLQEKDVIDIGNVSSSFSQEEMSSWLEVRQPHVGTTGI